MSPWETILFFLHFVGERISERVEKWRTRTVLIYVAIGSSAGVLIAGATFFMRKSGAFGPLESAFEMLIPIFGGIFLVLEEEDIKRMYFVTSALLLLISLFIWGYVEKRDAGEKTIHW